MTAGAERSQEYRPGTNGATAEAVSRLTDRERNVIILYRRGGPEALVIEGYARNQSEAEALLREVRSKISTQRVPAEPVVQVDLHERPDDPSSEAETLDEANLDDEVEHEDFPADEWPHTEGTVRRQIVEPEDKDMAGRVKRERLGRRDYSAILAAVPDDEEESAPSDVPGEETEASSDPRRSPILEWLERHEKGSASQIAEHLGRKTANVSTRLRQLEKGGFVRRTGRTIPGGRGGPQIEFELCHDTKPPTDIDDVLESPESPPRLDDEQREMRRRYFDALLAMLERPECPDHIFERIERLTGLAA